MKTRVALAKKHGFDPEKDMERLRKIFADADGTWVDKDLEKIKRDKLILDNIDMNKLVGLRTDNRKTVKYEDEFKPNQEMVKLKAKQIDKDGKKMSRKERVERRKAREQELTDVLKQAEESGGPINPDDAVDAINAAQFEAIEPTKRDMNRLQRLKRKAEADEKNNALIERVSQQPVIEEASFQ